MQKLFIRNHQDDLRVVVDLNNKNIDASWNGDEVLDKLYHKALDKLIDIMHVKACPNKIRNLFGKDYSIEIC